MKIISKFTYYIFLIHLIFIGWKEREIFGKIRYMNYAGCKRKFDINAFVHRFGARAYPIKGAKH